MTSPRPMDDQQLHDEQYLEHPDAPEDLVPSWEEPEEPEEPQHPQTPEYQAVLRYAEQMAGHSLSPDEMRPL